MIGSLLLTALTAVGGSAATGDSATTLPPLVIPASEAALASDLEGFTCLYQDPKVKTWNMMMDTSTRRFRSIERLSPRKAISICLMPRCNLRLATSPF